MARLGVGVELIIPKSSKRFVHVESALAILRGKLVTAVYAGTAITLTNFGDVFICSLRMAVIFRGIPVILPTIYIHFFADACSSLVPRLLYMHANFFHDVGC